MAGLALGLGAIALMVAGAMAFGTQPGVAGWGPYSLTATILTPAAIAAPGLALGGPALPLSPPG